MSEQAGVSVLGIFVADTAYQASRMPGIGETLTGSGFSVGPGGKGSNQAVAAARAGARTSFITKLGDDTFGKMALDTYRQVGVVPELEVMSDCPTGAAFIFVNDSNGENAIIVYPGSGGTLSAQNVEARRSVIESSKVFVTQLEQPVEAAMQGLKIARDAGVITIFNPAPAESFPEEMLSLCDFIIPNETEARDIVGFPVTTVEQARAAATQLRERGAGVAVITLGEKGVYVLSDEVDAHVPAMSSDTVIDTSGAGDAFVGGFSAALAAGEEIVSAVRFGCATAGISVTRRGTAPSMPDKQEIEKLLADTFGSES
ncbi:ribokinase [Granulosicoccus antarcticus]|uniref:Ribokinase n=1 Tax=Granulosicoccus antarcticus IMCC3135 TaxID=1192854 RepID=A0A2Z2NXB8_9GAMM|nr:ribokinase [Granulosicoccus antarcticus]ASJ74408.1 Ribokinase [Granulosicoccus antarcticus IMCC3135]